MNVRVYKADSRQRVHAYGLAIEIQESILDRMSTMVAEMRVIGKKCLLPFQKGVIIHFFKFQCTQVTVLFFFKVLYKAIML